MTSSGRCHACGEIAYMFKYTKPRSETVGHEGYWYCEKHGPKSEESEVLVKQEKVKDPTYGMNRKQRRDYIKQQKRKKRSRGAQHEKSL